MTTRELGYIEHVTDNINSWINVEARTRYSVSADSTTSSYLINGRSRPYWGNVEYQPYSNEQETDNIRDSDYVLYTGIRGMNDFDRAMRGIFVDTMVKTAIEQVSEMNFLKNIKFI